MSELDVIVIHIRAEQAAEYERLFAERELPRWREYKARGAFLSARISRVAFGTDDRNDVAKYVIAVEVPSHAAHSEHDADPGFQEFNRLADLLQPEDPLVYGGEVLHAVLPRDCGLSRRGWPGVLVPGLGAGWVIAGRRDTVERRNPAGTVACGSWLGSAGASAGRHADREITWLPSFAIDAPPSEARTASSRAGGSVFTPSSKHRGEFRARSRRSARQYRLAGRAFGSVHERSFGRAGEPLRARQGDRERICRCASGPPGARTEPVQPSVLTQVNK